MAGKGWRVRRALLMAFWLSALGSWQMAGAVPAVDALPGGGESSTASIEITGNNMSITGEGLNHVIAWDSFSIGKDASVTFGTGKNFLNFVRGGEASEIYGTMSGGNMVYLVNPHGVIIGNSARINVGSLIVSTKELDFSADFGAMVEQLGFLEGGEVVNRGTPLSAMKVSIANGVVTFENPGTGKAASSSLKSGAGEISLVGSLAKIRDDLNQDKVNGKYVLCQDVGETVTSMPGTFKGELYGGEHSVKLEIENGRGLFAEINKGKVQDLVLTGQVACEGGSGSVNVGALAGKAIGSNIVNVSNHASVTAAHSDRVGGILGLAENCSLEMVSNGADVMGRKIVGGIAGNMTGGTLKNAVNDGAVICAGTDSGINGYLGGLVGYVFKDAKIGEAGAGVVNNGRIEAAGYNYAGGIAGYMRPGYGNETNKKPSLMNAVNTGNISQAHCQAGGIAGYANNAAIGDKAAAGRDIINRGKVSADNRGNDLCKEIGGLVGSMVGGKLANAVNLGKVTVPEENQQSESIGPLTGSASNVDMTNVLDESGIAPEEPETVPQEPAPTPGSDIPAPGNDTPATGNDDPAPGISFPSEPSPQNGNPAPKPADTPAKPEPAAEPEANSEEGNALAGVQAAEKELSGEEKNSQTEDREEPLSKEGEKTVLDLSHATRTVHVSEEEMSRMINQENFS